MRRLLHALIVATVALAVLASAAGAETLSPPGVGAEQLQQRGPWATVFKDHGAAIRVWPSSEAEIIFNSRCGDVWPVIEQSGGWVKVQTDVGSGWIGGARVIVTQTPTYVDCSGARYLAPTSYVRTYVPTGCLSLRATPSREGRMLACVNNGHRYYVLDGPIDPGSGEDWFKVTSPSTGPGWVLAAHIYNE